MEHYSLSFNNYFGEFPISEETEQGLLNANYIQTTEIQQKTLKYGLEGYNILASAVTGSGKTLAYIIPVLECLYSKKWSMIDGIAAIIISPTRELAFQIFEALRKVGKYHDFSSALLIGGINLKFEKKRLDKCNILVATPGRLLQHMDENPLFNAINLQILVIDEADRCLDMGFKNAIEAIVENLPVDRQTLLFSATLTKSVRSLNHIFTDKEKYIEIDLDNLCAPRKLHQNYIVVDSHEKLNFIWSFIKHHPHQKLIIFLATCKQVKYVHDIFKCLRPRTTILSLHSKMHQKTRIDTYEAFMKKSSVVLFATDIASRGLDFPLVNWVVQLDCPEDINQYIHRAGRTARNKGEGESLLVTLPSEEHKVIPQLKQAGLTIRKLNVDSKKLFSIHSKICSFIVRNPELKKKAERAFVAYLKSVHYMRRNFGIDQVRLDLDKHAKSLGLSNTPNVKFMSKDNIDKLDCGLVNENSL